MEFSWDNKKNNINIKKHGLDFADAFEMFEYPMIIMPDQRKNYGEIRYLGLGHIKDRLMVIIFTECYPNIVRIISLRKANKREQRQFEITLKNRLETYRLYERRGN